MIGIGLALGMIGGGREGSLVVPGLLRGLTLTRAQAGGARSTALAADGATWVEYAADVPRFNGATQRLLVEGQRTNLVRNPRCEGASAGVFPTNMALRSTGGATVAVLGAAVRDGVSGFEVQFTFTSGQSVELNFDSSVPFTGGAVYGLSVVVSVVSGSLANIAGLILRLRTEAPFAENHWGPSLLGASSVLSRFSGESTVGAASTSGRMQLVLSPNGAGSVTLFLGLPQTELAAAASSPILPPVGTPGASTRGADLVSASLASLGISANGACTVLWSGVIDSNTVTQWLLQIDADNNGRRVAALVIGGTNFGRLACDADGSGAVINTANAITFGAVSRFGLSINGAGRAALCLNGGVPVSLSNAPTSGLLSMKVGNASGGTVPMWGEVGHLSVLPHALSDANLAARVAALPL